MCHMIPAVTTVAKKEGEQHCAKQRRGTLSRRGRKASTKHLQEVHTFLLLLVTVVGIHFQESSRRSVSQHPKQRQEQQMQKPPRLLSKISFHHRPTSSPRMRTPPPSISRVKTYSTVQSAANEAAALWWWGLECPH